MATGIRKRHFASCPIRNGGARCRCEGKWEASVYNKREGKPIYKSFDREADAKAWRSEATREVRHGNLQSPTKLTVEQAASQWLEGADSGAVRDRQGERYKPSTLRGYRQALRLRILPEFGAHRLSDVHAADVQNAVDRWLGEGLSGSTIRNSVIPMQAIYRHAVRRKLVSVNPASGLDLPSSDGKRLRIAPPTEAAALIAALPDTERPLWATAFYAGLRRGELRALRWSDVDLGRSEIRVERSWDEVEGPIGTKTESGARTVPLLGVLRDYLDAHKLRGERDGDDLVFGRTPSEAFVCSVVDRRAKKVWKAAELERITLHECRHTFASILIDAGANAKAISLYMGHSSIEITFDRYGHLMPGNREETRELVDRYLAEAAA